MLGFQDGAVADRYPGIWVYQQDRIHAGFGDGTEWNSFLTDPVLTPNEWNHVATTFDGTIYQAYVNGVLVFSTEAFAGKTPVASDRVNIGRIDSHFQGGIDDVRICNRALSAQEINVLLDGAGVPTIPVNGRFVTNPLLTNFDTPLAVQWLPDGRMLVAEQDGYVRLVGTDGVRQTTPLLDITDRVNSGTQDRGMLGLAIHPDFENTPYIYIAYTYDPPEVANFSGLGGIDGNGARVARISRFTVNSEGTFADPASELVLVGNASTYENIGAPNVRPALSDPIGFLVDMKWHSDGFLYYVDITGTVGRLEFQTA